MSLVIQQQIWLNRYLEATLSEHSWSLKVLRNFSGSNWYYFKQPGIVWRQSSLYQTSFQKMNMQWAIQRDCLTFWSRKVSRWITSIYQYFSEISHICVLLHPHVLGEDLYYSRSSWELTLPNVKNFYARITKAVQSWHNVVGI